MNKGAKINFHQKLIDVWKKLISQDSCHDHEPGERTNTIRICT